MKIADIQRAQKFVAKEFDERVELQSITERTSLLWKDVFNSRINFPSVDEFMAFRRNGATYGVGDPYYPDGMLLEAHCRKNASLLLEDGVDKDFLNKVSESCIGAPRSSAKHVLDFEASPNFLKNLRNAYRIYVTLREQIGDKSINICEIGAGYGLLATMLHQLFDVQSYTVIDLPQNLYLTSVYLSANFPEKTIQFLNKNLSSTQDLAELNFVFASDVSRVQCKYDLIINTDSFGEMPKESARAYVEWAKNCLSDQGVLHTDNRVRVRNNSGVMDFSDLGYLSGYEIFSIDGTRTQAELFSQPHHIFFMRKKSNQTYSADSWNLAAILYTIGLADSIDGCVFSDWNKIDPNAIKTILAFLTCGSGAGIESGLVELEKLGTAHSFINYIVFLGKFASGRFNSCLSSLVAYLDRNLSEPADAIARVAYMLLIINNKVQLQSIETLFRDFERKYPHLAEDVKLLIKSPKSSLRMLQVYATETLTARNLDLTFLQRVVRRLNGNYLP